MALLDKEAAGEDDRRGESNGEHERLKEALMLRNMTQLEETDHEHRKRISRMENGCCHC
ncbi:hypothetical protein BYT27DRAFT_7248662 [Phlegmacium glaucopus]|nr:hypothetical protein BYT27DRAFT_7248662 [Phlegmacium glaucopus]